MTLETLDLATAYGEELRSLRLAAGMTQEHASKALGVARANYTRSELGAHTPRLESFLRAAAFYKVEPVDLFRRVLERARARAVVPA